MKYYVLSSSSKKGNSTLIESNGKYLLIDAGTKKEKLKDIFNNLKISLKDIPYVLLTHEHTDHIYSLDLFKYSSVFTSQRLFNYLSSKTHLALANFIDVKPYVPFYLEDFKVTPILNSHDGKNQSFGFIIEVENMKISYVSDTGYIPTRNYAYLNDSDYYIFESNHDIKMLINSKRPHELIARILSDTGHLSNLAAADALENVVGTKTKEITLIHLSEDCNNADMALKEIKKHPIFDNIKVQVANYDEVTLGGQR
ncbi:MAG: MBL fold metallo-hydrolase [Bacillales bacterium]|jgi:phosphoribosyl 1,2-cyclic phosphodiesterase|nr:MBL fold metallo-hydrolase [Bacillales bacterium]